MALALTSTRVRAGFNSHLAYFALPLAVLVTAYAAWKIWYFGALIPGPVVLLAAIGQLNGERAKEFGRMQRRGRPRGGVDRGRAGGCSLK